MKSSLEELLGYIMDLEIFDTHEHLPAREGKREKPTDVLREYLYCYLACDLVSAGLGEKDLEKARNIELPLEERWTILEPYWEACRHTGYGRCVDAAVKGIYGIDGVRRETIGELNRKFQQSLEPGHFEKVLKEKSRIEISLLDSNLDCDERFFRSVIRLDIFVIPRTGEEINYIEEETGVKILDFEDWLEACEVFLDRMLSKGAVALKSALAYLRPLKYTRVTRSDAEKEFDAIWKRRHFPVWEPEAFTMGTRFQDYMMHFIMRLADARGLVVQFHTGLQHGNGNYIQNSDPALLSNLFHTYQGVRFDLFHMSYPFQMTAGVLAKNFPNVYLDMCWGHIISPGSAVAALTEWLELVPANKISAFGGDSSLIDEVYGHQLMARQNVARALAGKVDEGIFDLDRARELARMLLHDNPSSLFLP